jgi:hypothetical protein
MAESWQVAGDWFDVCRCRVPCGCTFAQAPDEDQCDGILAWHIREGSYGDVKLDDLNVVAVATFMGNIWAGEAKPKMGMFIDERADDAQREGLQTIFGGQAGGWPGAFGAMIDEVLGVEYAPIKFEIDDDLASWGVEVPGKAKGTAVALAGPTAPEGSRVQLHNPPGAEVGPGQVATWGVAEDDEVDAFGLKFSWPGRSSKHFPFAWSSEDEY